MYQQVFTAIGCGRFPFDMLRYDRCWPLTSADALTIGKMDASKKVVQLQRYVHTKNNEPTAPRWESFGWEVDNVNTIKIKT